MLKLFGEISEIYKWKIQNEVPDDKIEELKTTFYETYKRCLLEGMGTFVANYTGYQGIAIPYFQKGYRTLKQSFLLIN